LKKPKTIQEKPSSGRHQRLLTSVNRWLLVPDASRLQPENKLRNSQACFPSLRCEDPGWAFLVAPQNPPKKSQDYEKRPPRHFTQPAVMQSDAFSCTTPKFIQATRKACLPSRRAAFLLLKAEKVSRESPLVALFDLSLPPQPAGYTRFPFTANRSQSDAVSRRKPARHPWLIYGSPCACPLLSASDRLRVSVSSAKVSPRLAQ